MELKDILTIFIAASGLALGLLNSFKIFVLDRKMTLQLALKLASPVEGGYLSCNVDTKYPSSLDGVDISYLCFAIEIVNLSTFPVFISEVGFQTAKESDGRFPIVKPDTIPASSAPHKLEPRQAIIFYSKVGEVARLSTQAGFPQLKYIYALANGDASQRKAHKLQKFLQARYVKQR